MADFCKDCSIKMFGEDTRDMAGICTKDDDYKGMVANVICEGCGPTIVNSEGECVSGDCEGFMGKGHIK